MTLNFAIKLQKELQTQALTIKKSELFIIWSKAINNNRHLEKMILLVAIIFLFGCGGLRREGRLMRRCL